MNALLPTLWSEGHSRLRQLCKEEEGGADNYVPESGGLGMSFVMSMFYGMSLHGNPSPTPLYIWNLCIETCEVCVNQEP